MKLVIVGAGPTCLGAAFHIKQLQESGIGTDLKVTILEKEATAGGLAGSTKDDNGFTWDYGGHITFSHKYPAYDKAVRWAVDEWNEFVRNSQVDMSFVFENLPPNDLKLVPYPAQFSIPFLPKEIQQKCISDFKQCQTKSGAKPLNFDQWVMNNFGPTMNDVFFTPYNEKIWTVKLTEMNPDWVGTRVAKLEPEKLEELCAMKASDLLKVDFGWGPNCTFAYPKNGGTGYVWTSLADKLPQDWFSYNSEVTKIHPENKTVSFVKEGVEQQAKYDVLLSTLPLDVLGQVSGLYKTDLEYSRVIICGVGLKKPKPEWIEPHWLYFPDPEVPFHRLNFISNYSEALTPDPQKYWSMLTETSRKPTESFDKEKILQNTIESLKNKGFIPDESLIVDRWVRVLPYGYPIPTVNRDKELKRIHEILVKNGIYSRGRFGGWKYEVANQDHSFMQGKEIIDRILDCGKETVY